MPEDKIIDKRIRASEFVQDCAFKRFRVVANPGLLGVIKDIKEDLFDGDELGEPVCLLITGKDKRDLCVRGICPFKQILEKLKNREE
jgi:hypothetical protein